MKINNSERSKQSFTRLTISADAKIIGGKTLKKAIPELRKNAKGFNVHIGTIGTQDRVQTLILKISELKKNNYYRWISLMRDKNDIFESAGNQLVSKKFSQKSFIKNLKLIKNELVTKVQKPISAGPYNLA